MSQLRQKLVHVTLVERQFPRVPQIVGAIICILLSVMGISCATTRSSTAASLDDLSALSVNPLECTNIVLKKDITIRKEVIHEPSVMQNRFLVVLRYREGGGEKEVNPSLLPGYNNISLVSEVEQLKGDMPLVIYQRYVVVEMWRLYPNDDRKICYLWTIGDKGVSMKLMLEDLGGKFLSERPIALSNTEQSQLTKYYLKLMKTLLEALT